ARAGPARPSTRPATGRQPGRTWPRQRGNHDARTNPVLRGARPGPRSGTGRLRVRRRPGPRAGPAAPASWAQAATTGQAPGTFADPLAARPVGSLPRTAPAASAGARLAWDGGPVRCPGTAGPWPPPLPRPPRGRAPPPAPAAARPRPPGSERRPAWLADPPPCGRRRAAGRRGRRDGVPEAGPAAYHGNRQPGPPPARAANTYPKEPSMDS